MSVGLISIRAARATSQAFLELLGYRIHKDVKNICHKITTKMIKDEFQPNYFPDKEPRIIARFRYALDEEDLALLHSYSRLWIYKFRKEIKRYLQPRIGLHDKEELRVKFYIDREEIWITVETSKTTFFYI